MAATAGVVQDLLPALEHLAESLSRKGSEFAEVVKSGRTHLMDATPVTLGQEFNGYAQQIRRGADAGAGDAARGSPSCRWAGRRSGPGSTRRPGSRPR